LLDQNKTGVFRVKFRNKSKISGDDIQVETFEFEW
jgi:hypothetical protein